jgi:AcrR family transcriptional regulator
MLITMSPTVRDGRGRAAPMAPDERRRAIVDVVLPLLLEHGSDVTTRQIAEAAGIAEGTIFRVFPDKAALLMAAAEDTMNPANGRAELAAALEGVTDLRQRVVVTARRLADRSEKVVAVMMALRGVWLAQGAEHSHPKGERPTPPQFVLDSHSALLDRLTEVFEPHRAELSVEPRRAALLLRTLVLGVRHPGAEPGEVLGPEEIADALLDGIRARTEPRDVETDLASWALGPEGD